MTATFHEGELALQRRAGSYEQLAAAGPRVVRDHMPEQHREFFAQLPFLVAGTVDPQGQPWASVLAAPPGFARSPDARQLEVAARPLAHDPLNETLAEGIPIGLLGIEPHTRRRNRMNGKVLASNGEGFTVEVGQSFGNCPKYIQARKPEFVGTASDTAATVQHMTQLDAAASAIVDCADTFFIATAHPQAGAGDGPAFGVDVSHRGGKPGFVKVDAGRTLTVPDFVGNSFFNTLGNLQLNPRCGLLFIDFDNGDLLYLAARGVAEWEGPELQAFEGAQRLLRFELQSVQLVRGALPLRWGAAEMSPHLAKMGAWG